VPITTIEGVAAVDEAIKYLEAATEAKKDDKSPGPPPKLRRLDGDTDAWKTAPIIGTAALTEEDDMTSACKDHVDDTGPTGVVGHKGTDDSTPETRLDKYGVPTVIVSESMSYGTITGVDVMR